MINLPSTRMNLIRVNLPSVKSELSLVNLPTAGIIMGKFTYCWNILGSIQIWVYLPGPKMINLPSTRTNLIWVNLPSFKSELSWVNLPTAGTFWEQFISG